MYLLLFSFIQYLKKKKKVPTQPNNSSSIWSCFLLDSNTTDAISLSRKDTPEPPTPGTKKVCHVFGGGDRGRSSVQSCRWRQEDREQGISAFLFTIVFHTQEKQSFTLLPRINTSGSKINIKRNSTSREFQHHLQISSCHQFTRKKGSGAPFDECIEGLGNGTLPVDRFHCSQICYTESVGKNSHRTATVKATRGQNKIIRELQGNAIRVAIKKKKDSTRKMLLIFIQAPRSWSEPKTKYNKSSNKSQTGPATMWPTKCSNTVSHFSYTPLMDTWSRPLL